MSQLSTGLGDAEKRTGRTGLLTDFVDNRALAKELDVCERSVRNWQNEPGGMPYSLLGRLRVVHIPTAREWLLKKQRRPNPERRRRKRER